VKSLVEVLVHSHGGSSVSHRPLGRLLGIAPAALLLSGLLAAWGGPLVAPVAAAGSAAKTLTVSGIVSPYVAGVAHSVTVTAKDAYGNTATGYRGKIHFSGSDPAAVLPANYTFTATDAGTHKFTNGLTLKTAGTQWVRATDTVTNTITGVKSSIVVTPAKAKTLTVSGIVSPYVAGVAHSVTVTKKTSSITGAVTVTVK
jgi:hypothetical protein